MKIKIDILKIKHQYNIGMFVWDCEILIKSKTKQIIKLNYLLT